MKFIAATVIAAATIATVNLAVSPALAQRAQRPPAEITIVNARDVAVTSLEIATTGDNPRLVGRVTRALGPGQSVKLRLNRPTGCSLCSARGINGADAGVFRHRRLHRVTRASR